MSDSETDGVVKHGEVSANTQNHPLPPPKEGNYSQPKGVNRLKTGRKTICRCPRIPLRYIRGYAQNHACGVQCKAKSNATTHHRVCTTQSPEGDALSEVEMDDNMNNPVCSVAECGEKKAVQTKPDLLLLVVSNSPFGRNDRLFHFFL